MSPLAATFSKQRLIMGFRPTDIFIPVMGVTGAGKSTFISLCTKESVPIGHELESCAPLDRIPLLSDVLTFSEALKSLFSTASIGRAKWSI